jgi:hypothetical protein
MLKRKAGGEDELGQMHRHEQAAHLCEHRKCDEHSLDEKEKSSIIAFAVTGGDTIEVIEEPDAIIRGQ